MINKFVYTLVAILGIASIGLAFAGSSSASLVSCTWHDDGHGHNVCSGTCPAGSGKSCNVNDAGDCGCHPPSTPLKLIAK